MTKNKTTRYGTLTILKGAVYCTIENGGDNKGKAVIRFSDNGKRATNTQTILITDELATTDFYGDTWIHTKKGWIKAEDRLTWYNTYKEAKEAVYGKNHTKRKILLIIPIVILVAVIAYKLYKRKQTTPIIETPNEIQMD